MGRITQMVSQDGTSDYGYDPKSQLTSATHSYQSNESYTFDNNGNRTMSGYQTGTDNRLTNDETYSYTYVRGEDADRGAGAPRKSPSVLKSSSISGQ